jgi:flagellar hook-basal body complex protein FliE
MADPLGLIGGGGTGGNPFVNRSSRQPGGAQAGTGGEVPGQSFKDVMLQNLDEVNKLQQEATRAAEDYTAGERTDVEGVILATQKADNAFRMLQSLRNRMMEAYDEVKQIRV